MRLLYYAVGGGLGHLTRARAWLHTTGRTAGATIMTASTFAGDRRVVGDVPVIEIPPSLSADPVGYQQWLATTIERSAPEEIVLDTFPCGILGEFAEASFLEGITLHHVARLLRWHVYQPLIRESHPRFATTWRVEALDAAHDAWLGEHSDSIVDIDLIDPPTPSPDEAIATLRAIDTPLWLVVHSGPTSEIDELLAYAEEMKATERSPAQIILIAPILPADPAEGLLQLDVYPVRSLFPMADRIITACGFNAMRQTAPFRDRHRCIPFPRRYDDQFRRRG